MAIVDIAKITSILEELGGQTTIADLVVCIGGILVLLVWAIRTSLGTKALDNAPARENIMPPLWALIPFFLWFGTVSVLYFIKEKLLAGLPDWQDAIADNLMLCLGVIPAIVTSVMIARLTFARGLKGLGLNPKTIPRDFVAAFLNLLADYAGRPRRDYPDDHNRQINLRRQISNAAARGIKADNRLFPVAGACPDCFHRGCGRAVCGGAYFPRDDSNCCCGHISSDPGPRFL